MTSEQDIDSDLVAELLPFFIDDVVERFGSIEQMVVSFSQSLSGMIIAGVEASQCGAS